MKPNSDSRTHVECRTPKNKTKNGSEKRKWLNMATIFGQFQNKNVFTLFSRCDDEKFRVNQNNLVAILCKQLYSDDSENVRMNERTIRWCSLENKAISWFLSKIIRYVAVCIFALVSIVHASWSQEYGTQWQNVELKNQQLHTPRLHICLPALLRILCRLMFKLQPTLMINIVSTVYWLYQVHLMITYHFLI